MQAIEEIDPVTEFACWLTTRDGVIAVGASETVYAMFDALGEFQRMKAAQAEPPQPTIEGDVEG